MVRLWPGLVLEDFSLDCRYSQSPSDTVILTSVSGQWNRIMESKCLCFYCSVIRGIKWRWSFSQFIPLQRKRRQIRLFTREMCSKLWLQAFKFKLLISLGQHPQQNWKVWITIRKRNELIINNLLETEAHPESCDKLNLNINVAHFICKDLNFISWTVLYLVYVLGLKYTYIIAWKKGLKILCL